MLNVLMVGVGSETKGGMWSVAKTYLESECYNSEVRLRYIPTATAVTAPMHAKIWRALTGCARAMRSIEDKDMDIVHVHMAERGSYFRKSLVIRKAYRRGVRIVLHMHGGSFKAFFDSSCAQLKRHIVDTLRMADAVVVLGECFRIMFEEIGVDAQRIFVIPNGVRTPENLPIKSNAHDVIFLGVITESKGVFDLLDAATKLAPMFRTRYKLKLFGPEAEIDIRREIASKSLSDFVEYAGFLKPDDMREQFEKACLAVLPSHFEVLPMCILETMSYGIPNVACNVGSIDTVIADGVNGKLVPPHNAELLAESMKNLLLDEDGMTTMGLAAHRTIAESFSESKHIEAIVKLYSLISKRG